MGKLVSTRRIDEGISIITENGQKIEITVVNIRGKQVRLAIECDDSIKVVRSELDLHYQEVENEWACTPNT